MSEAITGVLKLAFGFISNKLRTTAAEKLQDGGLTDQKFREWIVPELDDIKSKLDAMSRKDLRASINFFKIGIERLKISVGESCQSGDPGESPSTSTKSAQQLEDAVALANGNATGKLKIESSERCDLAKKSFEKASTQATLAFENTSLSTEERILASKVLLASGILEHLEDAEMATSDCLQYLKELHDMPAIKEIFSVYVQGGVKSLFKKDSRKEIVESVRMINLILADFISTFTKRRMGAFDWPTIECGKTVVHPIYCKDEGPPNLRKITTPWDIAELKGDHFLKKYIFTLNKKGDLICFTKAKGGPQKLVKTTHELQPYCHPESRNDVLSMAVDDDGTLYVLTDKDRSHRSFSLSVYSADGRNKDKSTLKFITSSFIAEICITNNKSIVIADTYPSIGKVYICNRNGELINSFNPCEDPAPHCWRIHFVSVSSNDELALITSNGNDFLKDFYRLSTYTQDGKFQRTVKFRTSSDSSHDYRDIHYNHVTNTIIGYATHGDDKASIEFVSGETGELQRSYLLYSTNFPGISFWDIRLVCHANGTMALVGNSDVIYLQNPPPST